ncbi:hypothetical protein [Geomonas ferrireducens]|uniref:hypothetical protein n=1 Tax=Geomonas ferrireducens TaxID=2570227 RepID=UPI0010A75447|nr:hypothetical protein [Geomonas ferrireducens]
MRTLAVIIFWAMCSTVAAAYAGEESNAINGKWVKLHAKSAGCGCGECIDIQLGVLQSFCVESNQIYLNVRYLLDAKLKRVYLFWESVVEVGSGGAALPWDKFDKRKPLAELDISTIKQGTIRMNWFGLRRWDNPSKRYSLGDGYAGTYTQANR